LVTEELARAVELRLAGRWDEALSMLEPLGDDPAALCERILVLADENLLARDRSDELDAALGKLEGGAPGDPAVQAFVLDRKGLKLHGEFLRDRNSGEPPDELSLFEQALAIRRELGDEAAIAESIFHVGLVHQIVRGDQEGSRPFFDESYERARAAGDRLLMSYAIRHVAFCDQEAGDLERAEAGFRESLTLRVEAGWVPGIAAAQLGLALLLEERGAHDEAVELARAARTGFESLGAGRFLGLVERELEELESAAG
jgi:tetratricopeptide (TPR) repeat protein